MILKCIRDCLFFIDGEPTPFKKGDEVTGKTADAVRGQKTFVEVKKKKEKVKDDIDENDPGSTS